MAWWLWGLLGLAVLVTVLWLLTRGMQRPDADALEQHRRDDRGIDPRQRFPGKDGFGG